MAGCLRRFSIIGTGRNPLTNEEFRNKLLEGINQFSRNGKVTDDKWKIFSEHIFLRGG
jgi:Glucose-6-phosphate 1-dehydrogenase